MKYLIYPENLPLIIKARSVKEALDKYRSQTRFLPLIIREVRK